MLYVICLSNTMSGLTSVMICGALSIVCSLRGNLVTHAGAILGARRKIDGSVFLRQQLCMQCIRFLVRVRRKGSLL